MLVAEDRTAVGVGCDRLALAGARAGGRRAGGAPRFDGAVAQRPVGRIGPAEIEQGADLGLVFARLDKAVEVAGMGDGLAARDEAGAHPDAGGAEHERRGETAAVGDAAGGNDGHVTGRVDDGGDQRHRADLTPDVAACLPALGDDDVDAGVDRALRLVGARHRLDRLGAGGMHATDQRAGIAPEEGDQSDTGVEADAEALVLIEVEREVDGERLGRQRAGLRDDAVKRRRLAPGKGMDAEAAGVRYRRDERWPDEVADRRLDDRRGDAEEIGERRREAFGHGRLAFELGQDAGGAAIWPTTGRCSISRNSLTRIARAKSSIVSAISTKAPGPPITSWR